MGAFAFAGQVAVFPATLADLSVGYAYAIYLLNDTDTAVNSGTIAIETADAKADDRCEPDTWFPLPAVPDCSDPAGTNPGNAVIDLAQTPVGPHSQCSFSFACPHQFLRLGAVPAGLTAVIVVGRLRRTDWTFGTRTGETEVFTRLASPMPMAQVGQQAPAQVTQQTPQPATTPATTPAPEPARVG